MTYRIEPTACGNWRAVVWLGAGLDEWRGLPASKPGAERQAREMERTLSVLDAEGIAKLATEERKKSWNATSTREARTIHRANADALVGLARARWKIPVSADDSNVVRLRSRPGWPIERVDKT